MTTPKPEPASDADLAVVRPLGYRCIGCVLGTPPETHGSACIFAMEPRLLARIEADREEIARLEKIEAAAVQFIGFYHADEDRNAVLWALGILSELVAPGEMAKTRALADQPKPEPGR